MSVRPAYLVDTDVLIWCLRNRPAPIAMLQALAAEGPLACSVRTVSEVLRMVKDQDLEKTERLLDSLIPLPVGIAEAKLAALLMRNRGRDRGPGFVDCHIAATAILRRTPLVTYNRKDYFATGVDIFDTSLWNPENR